MDALLAMWWVLYALVAFLGIGSAGLAAVADRRPRPEDVRHLLEHAPLDLFRTGLLSGGTVRAIDARIVDLVERGLVDAGGGRLSLSPDAPATPDAHDAWLLDTVRTDGAHGVDAVRRRAATRVPRSVLDRMARRGLIVAPAKRRSAPMVFAGPTLAGVAGCTFGMMLADPAADVEISAAVAVLLWFPAAIVPARITAGRPGYSGPDPASGLGRAVLDSLRTGLPADASEARRVALGGFDAMADTALRDAVQGNEPDSRWSVGSGHRDVGVNAALAPAAGFDDRDSDSGDAGD
ncbi:uncharacterized protein (TIGR04222 family) [Haloactinopolyspora alba]|uniref:Uncharacterized protein (TIGR04222 family) n=1 Tax=Haloactinopolyspora alba TaxID=648780 RepID=A0A2P8DY54_9ACTN|nr:uncharacterized protein (TIGR04222 family) [Haloactinopolyspora alba]